ncbi:hypothetical protein GCM10023232_24500 [Sphingosinicella ginsenosidimutans]
MTRDYPYPPRAMTRQRAAAYCDLAVSEFEREVTSGRLPQPFRLGNRDHWSRAALDEALAAMAGEGENTDWRKGQPLYAA